MTDSCQRPVLRLRVYWEDTDAGGVVYHANYLRYFERARTEWLRERGFDQTKLLADTNLLFVVADGALRYAAPARLDDVIDVSVALASSGRASLTLKQQALRGATLLAEATLRLGCVEAGTFRTRRIPNAILERLA